MVALPVRPELKELVAEASRALACLDADRLEELALSCQALIRHDGMPMNPKEHKLLNNQAREAANDMAVFARVLDATRANVQVMQRLRSLRAGKLEYARWEMTGSGDGND